ncbi:MAG: S8 family serine peptidase [Bacteroidota bacterium]
MSNIKVRFGKKELQLEKSNKIVGLKKRPSTNQPATFKGAPFVRSSIYNSLGGFNVVSLRKDGETVDDKLDEVREYDAVEVGTHVYYAEGSDRMLVPTGEIYITFHEGVGEEEQMLTLDEFKLELVRRRTKEILVAKVTRQSKNPLKVAATLEQFSLVRVAEPDIDAQVEEYDFVEPGDELLEHQWHLKNYGFVADANWRLKKDADSKVVDAWKRIGNMGSQDVVIAVVDNGFDLTHPDLKSRVYKPWDLWNNSSRVQHGDPRFTHGTPCASVALAASNGRGMVGAAPNAKFMPLSGTSFSLRATEQMFEYCVKNGADVISCSWGTTDPTFSLSGVKEEVIKEAATKGRNGKGCVILFAVGNDFKDYVNYYSAHPDVIAVAASTSKDEHADYSNRGREVTVCAPSNGDWPIIAARAWWDEGVSWETGAYKYWRDGKARGETGLYKHFGGTSSSTPLVAGICALMLSVNPDLTARQVKEILIKTADKIGSPLEYDSNGHSLKYGYGKVNADKAVKEALRYKDESVGTALPVVDDSIKKGRGIFRFNVSKQEPVGYGVQIGAFAEYGC